MYQFFESVIPRDIITLVCLISFVGRLMFQLSTLVIYSIYSWESSLTCFIKGAAKFFDFNGQPEARLNRDDSIYGHPTNRRTWFIKSISIFLFSAPDVHLENLQNMYVDGLMYMLVWEELLKKVTDEWQDFILYVSNKSQATTCLKVLFFFSTF